MMDSNRRTVLTTGAAAAATAAASRVFAQAQQPASAQGLPDGAKVGFYEAAMSASVMPRSARASRCWRRLVAA